MSNAILLPVVLRFNLPGQEDKVRRMAQAMDLSDTSVEGFIAAIEDMLDQTGIPNFLGEIGVPADCSARIAEKALKDSAARTNPRVATLSEVVAMTETAIARPGHADRRTRQMRNLTKFYILGQWVEPLSSATLPASPSQPDRNDLIFCIG